MNIGDGIHIASPVHKVVVFARHSNEVNHGPLIVDKHSLTGGGYFTSFGAGDGEAILTLQRLNSDTKPIKNVLCLANDHEIFGASKNQPHELSIFIHCGA